MSPTARTRLHAAYTACRQVGLPSNTVTAFARAVFPAPSSTWTATQQLFVALWLSLTAMICEQDSRHVTAFIALTPVLQTDPPDGVSQWLAQCFHALTARDPTWADHLRQVLRHALLTP
ncbi:hypothetical protein SAMN00768000_3678 [Sulfobacillus thermosulfidooxidans DSM 9293]|uniref:Uncharacterized protein n=2 Tax=Sulfobacillus thermosulfidooxidans TaxID=28034 RepID=A0A1W1WPA9_SULTA|nr:hypothetical protein [Sulfobacillus thermosulfidooxidans]PSR20420.1 MAG: hypothetical protein C7B47_18035 [Sulfobacillus thermosulfidooxidans]SMC08141.1 hypothetical protein SAMN00768000_3678 [Sulfobacillus thermosulfidooxidans DSM 9293]